MWKLDNGWNDCRSLLIRSKQPTSPPAPPPWQFRRDALLHRVCKREHGNSRVPCLSHVQDLYDKSLGNIPWSQTIMVLQIY